MTFEEIYTRIMKKCHHDPTTDTDLLEIVKNFINSRYQETWAYLRKQDPIFGRASSSSVTIAPYQTGTVETDETTTIIGTDTVWVEAMEGRKFKLDSYAEVYEIVNVDSATEITLENAVNDDADSELTYIIYDDIIALPADCADITAIKQDITGGLLKPIGLAELRKKQADCPISVDPLKILDPVYYTRLNSSQIIVYPAPARQIQLIIDYTINLTELSDDEDEPILPIEQHNILVQGGIADLLFYKDDPRADQEETKFYNMLANLARKNAFDTDMITFKPKIHRT